MHPRRRVGAGQDRAAAPALTSLWRAWVALLDRREDATALAVCRILAAFTLFHHLAATWLSGAYAMVWLDVDLGGMRRVNASLLDWVGGPSPAAVHATMAAGLIAAVLLGAGVYTRASAVVAWLAFRTLVGLNDHSGGSSDELLVNVLFVLLFSGCGNALSFDARVRGKTAPVPAWPRYVLIGQLVLMYWMTALQKVSAGWIPGGSLDALWFILQQATWQRRSMEWMAPLYPLTQLGTAVTWIFEQAAPLLLLSFFFRDTADRHGRVRSWFNRTDFRTKYLAVGLVLHLGIWAALEVGPFLGTVLALYACCFHPDEWRRFAARSVSRWPRRA